MLFAQEAIGSVTEITGHRSGCECLVWWCVDRHAHSKLWEHRGGALTLQGGQDASSGPVGREAAGSVLRSGSTALEGSWCFGPFKSLSVSRTDCHSFQVSIPLSVKGRIIMETIEGMRYLHGEGVIHKDLKPENILVDSDFHIKVTTVRASGGQRDSDSQRKSFFRT